VVVTWEMVSKLTLAVWSRISGRLQQIDNDHPHSACLDLLVTVVLFRVKALLLTLEMFREIVIKFSCNSELYPAD